MTPRSGGRARLALAAVGAGLVLAGATAYAVSDHGASDKRRAPTANGTWRSIIAATLDRDGFGRLASNATRARAAFPNSSNTGVPRDVRLTPYTGPCTITSDNTVIDAKVVNCDLTIRARYVVIRRSRINGYVSSGTDKNSGYSFMLERSTVDASPRGPRQVTAVGEINFTVIRSHVFGGNRGANCWYACTIVGSYVHGQDTDPSGTWHESGIRMGERAVIRANTIACDAPDVPPDGGCSAPLTGYGDFGPVRDNVIDGNLFKATTGGACAYGGSSRGKPFSNAASGIRFANNVFERGKTGHCGVWFAITDFDPSAPGNAWRRNVWDRGGAVRP